MWQSLSELPSRLLHYFAVAHDWVTSKWLAISVVDEDAPLVQRWIHWLLLLPIWCIIWLFGVIIWVASVPVRGWFLSPQNRACYLRGLPAFLCLIAIAAIIAGHAYFDARFAKRYSSRAISSFAEKKMLDGVLLAKRLVSSRSNPVREDFYVYGIANANLDRMDVAEEVMAVIAPAGRIGYPPAHQFQAIALIKEYESDSSDKPKSNLLDALEWHLERAGFRDQEQRLLMWASLYQARNNAAKTAETLAQAGKLNPVHYFALSEVELIRNNPTGSKQALEKAVDVFGKQLSKRPADKYIRIRYASALAKLKRFQEAEETLVVGLEFHQDEEMQKALSDLYVTRYDACSETDPFVEKISPLMQAMTLDLNRRDVYLRLERLFHRELDSDTTKQLQATFENLLVSGFNPTAAHFALGFLSILRADEASHGSWHLGQAQSLQPPMAIAYSNLANILAHANPPRLYEAELFARQSVSGQVQEPSLYVILGKVLNAKGDYRATVECLTPMIQKYPESEPLRETLAEAVSAVNKTDSIPVATDVP